MNAALAHLLSPQPVALLLTAAMIGACTRASTTAPGETDSSERLVWLIPALAVPLALVASQLAGPRGAWWLGRVNLAVVIGLVLCAVRVVSLLAAEGAASGRQALVFTLAVALGSGFMSVANAVAFAGLLREQKQWLVDILRGLSLRGAARAGAAAAANRAQNPASIGEQPGPEAPYARGCTVLVGSPAGVPASSASPFCA